MYNISLTDYKIQHIFREGNRVVDKLANAGIDSDSLTSLDMGKSIPIDLLDLIGTEVEREGIG